MKPEVKIFPGSTTTEFTKKVTNVLRMEAGQVDLQIFSDGEFRPRFEESIRGTEVFLIQSTNPPGNNILELCMMNDAAKRASAAKIINVIPYYGFARQDRKDKPRTPITAKLMADMLQTSGATRIITMDLHAAQIQGYFDIPVDHLEASAVFVPYIQGLNIEDLTFAAPDPGSANRVREYSNYFNAGLVICDKHRKKANEVDKIIVIGDVEGKNVVIIDDMADTAGTLKKTAEAIMEKGAKSVRALCTHPVLSGKAYENIEESPLSELVVTDTLPLKKESKKIKVLSVADLFATAIERVVENKSVHGLFVFNKSK